MGNVRVSNHPAVSALTSHIFNKMLNKIFNNYLSKYLSVHTFPVSHLTKTCERGKKPHPNLKFCNFLGGGKPCACKAIDSYLERHNVWGVGESQFLVTILNHMDLCFHQHYLGGWGSFLQWQV